MRLVIAEKPSVAQSIAAVLGAKSRHDGYLEGGGYIVSWCFGHLAELADAAVYNADDAKWTLAALPIIPTSFRFIVRSEKQKQFDILRELMRREDVAEVVNACDAGREGELIFRTVYCLAGCSKPILRLWISSMEDDAIRSGFQQLKSGRDYDGLHQSALCRAKADWLVGINATRYFSLTYGRTLNIGRVMSPTLALLVQREAEISAFVAEPFYTVQLDCGFPAATDRMKDRKDADAIANACKGKAVTVKSVERKEKSEKAPALYDLTSLQRDANRVLGYTSQQTLDYLQALYEKKLCTYPRTDSRFLTDDMEGSVPGLVAAAAAVCGMEKPPTICAKQVCSSKKVTDHHAIVPTISAEKVDMASLPLGEREVLKLAARGLLRAVDEPHRYAETVITVDCAGQSFTAKGKTVLAPGWKRYEQEQAEAASALPVVTEQQTLSVSAASVKTGKTTPPKHFTEDTLLAAMENAGKEDMPDDAERKGIGTPPVARCARRSSPEGSAPTRLLKLARWRWGVVEDQMAARQHRWKAAALWQPPWRVAQRPKSHPRSPSRRKRNRAQSHNCCLVNRPGICPHYTHIHSHLMPLSLLFRSGVGVREADCHRASSLCWPRCPSC